MTFLPYLYFSYGSNLSLTQMRRRCPGAEPVGPFGITGWRLTFCGNLRNTGVANAEEGSAGDILEGALYKITAVCEAMLDVYEGASHADPRRRVYRKLDFRIPSTGEEAMMYVMTTCRPAPPSDAYLGRIADGYRDWGINRKGLYAAARLAGWRPAPEPTAVVTASRDVPVHWPKGWPRPKTVAPAPRRILEQELATSQAEARQVLREDLLLSRARRRRPEVKRAKATHDDRPNGIGTGNRFVP